MAVLTNQHIHIIKNGQGIYSALPKGSMVQFFVKAPDLDSLMVVLQNRLEKLDRMYEDHQIEVDYDLLRSEYQYLSNFKNK